MLSSVDKLGHVQRGCTVDILSRQRKSCKHSAHPPNAASSWCQYRRSPVTGPRPLHSKSILHFLADQTNCAKFLQIRSANAQWHCKHPGVRVQEQPEQKNKHVNATTAARLVKARQSQPWSPLRSQGLNQVSKLLSCNAAASGSHWPAAMLGILSNEADACPKQGAGQAVMLSSAA